MQFDSRHRYLHLLRHSKDIQKFKENLAILQRNDPYFPQVYLELFWTTEEQGDFDIGIGILRDAYKMIKTIVSSRTLQNSLSDWWTTYEVEALEELVGLINTYGRISAQKKSFLVLSRFLIQTLIRPKTVVVPKDAQYIQLVKQIDVQPLLQELQSLPYSWWSLHKEVSSHNKHTHSILLRERMLTESEYKPHDGVHESGTTKAAKVLPRLQEAVVSFAEEKSIALGRVTIELLKPGTQVYRHIDSEEMYKKRDSYHLVLQAGQSNVLSSADEEVNAQPGEIWFFSNKVMHRAHNRSSIPRIHVIFDGYPLSSGNETQKT